MVKNFISIILYNNKQNNCHVVFKSSFALCMIHFWVICIYILQIINGATVSNDKGNYYLRTYIHNYHDICHLIVLYWSVC